MCSPKSVWQNKYTLEETVIQNIESWNIVSSSRSIKAILAVVQAIVVGSDGFSSSQ